MRSVPTRFRAYQLGSPGSSFSYFAGGHFTLVEARLTDLSRRSLGREMRRCGVEVADTLHITSWDQDHCSVPDLEELLETVRPRRIKCPGYLPSTECGIEAHRLIREYRDLPRLSNLDVQVKHITPRYIEALSDAESLGFEDIFYHPRRIDPDCANNNSTVKFFRKGSFNVLSLGDVEDPNINSYLRRTTSLRRETDVMILAHHGADNGFTNKSLLERLEPSVAVCSSDYDNKYDHPHQEIRNLLRDEGVDLFTTKTGDVVIRSSGDHTGAFEVINMKSDSTDISSCKAYTSKKSKLLSFNADTRRQILVGVPAYRRIGRS